MITKQDFLKARNAGDLLIYDYGFNEYCYIKPFQITKTKGDNFWFTATIANTGTIENKAFYKVGTVHSFSNSFITRTITEMIKHKEAYKKTCISFLKSSLKA